MDKQLRLKFEKLKELCPLQSELIESIYESVDELYEEISDLQSEVEENDNHVESIINERDEAQSEIEDLQDTLPKNLYDESKHDICQRLNKNLSLEQLENIEQVVKNQFKGEKKNYILELP